MNEKDGIFLKKKYFKYKQKYKLLKQNGGVITFSSDDLKWTNITSYNEYVQIKEKIGEPNKICLDFKGNVEYVVWQDAYENFELGKFGGLDFLKVTNYHAKKHHPKTAAVFIIAGKYIYVPDILLGPIKYASETINVEQLFVQQNSNEQFSQTGKKSMVLVTGSCASIIISTMTVDFVMKMIDKYKHLETIDLKLHETFKNAYDKMISDYLLDITNIPKMDWFNPNLKKK